MAFSLPPPSRHTHTTLPCLELLPAAPPSPPAWTHASYFSFLTFPRLPYPLHYHLTILTQRSFPSRQTSYVSPLRISWFCLFRVSFLWFDAARLLCSPHYHQTCRKIPFPHDALVHHKLHGPIFSYVRLLFCFPRVPYSTFYSQPFLCTWVS